MLHNLVGLRLDCHHVAIQVFHRLLETEQCFFQGQSSRDEKVVSYSPEGPMWFLLDCENEIATSEIRHLLSLLLENYGVPIRHSFLYIYSNLLIIANNSPPLAVWAFGGRHLALATTLRACGLHLDLHSESHLHVLQD